jgi:hypothetical protein
MPKLNRRSRISIALAILFGCSGLTTAQQEPVGTKRSEAVRAAIAKFDASFSPYRSWLDQDVIWIITDEERAAFKLLRGGFPVCKRDRGRFYIMYGPPDEVESYAPKTQYKAGVADPSSFPLEVWHYRSIAGIGENIVLEFVDSCNCGDFKMPATPVRAEDVRSYATGRLDDLLWAGLGSAAHEPSGGLVDYPKIKFKDLEEKAIVEVGQKTLPFDVEIKSVKATDFTNLVAVTMTIQTHDLKPIEKIGTLYSGLKIFGRVTKANGWVAEIFEDTFETIESGNSKGWSFVKAISLPNDRYKLVIAMQDANGESWGRWAGFLP